MNRLPAFHQHAPVDDGEVHRLRVAKDERGQRVVNRRARVGDGKDVAHKKSLENGGSNALSNLQVQDRSTNRGWRKGSGSYNPDKK